MKNVLLVFLVLGSCNCFGQDTSFHQRVFMAGRELQKFKTIYTASIGVEIGGGIVFGLGISGNKNSTLTTIGGGCLLVGFLMQMMSFSHIGTAGMYMENRNIIIPIPAKKHRQT